MIKAFVFGKFLPFHKGHEAMINFALTKCDHLTVLICCSDKEKIAGTDRKSWIDKTFEKNPQIETRIFNYNESELPNTSQSSADVSKIWSDQFKKILPEHSLVITSEPYGDFVAKYMNIRHETFDIQKTHFPISATLIRNDLFTYWQYLPSAVKEYFSIKVIILGTESTGKTTLTKKISAHYNCSFVEEVGREIITNSNSFSEKELLLIAAEHAARINKVIIGDSPLTIIDTDIHTTKSYSKFTFGKDLIVTDEIYNANNAGVRFYLNNDVAYFQDGTRLSEAQRNLLDISHRQVLKDHSIAIVEIAGNWQERFEKITTLIDQLIINKNSIYL